MAEGRQGTPGICGSGDWLSGVKERRRNGPHTSDLDPEYSLQLPPQRVPWQPHYQLSQMTAHPEITCSEGSW